jgi:hypothetical protein
MRDHQHEYISGRGRLFGRQMPPSRPEPMGTIRMETRAETERRLGPITVRELRSRDELGRNTGLLSRTLARRVHSATARGAGGSPLSPLFLRKSALSAARRRSSACLPSCGQYARPVLMDRGPIS